MKQETHEGTALSRGRDHATLEPKGIDAGQLTLQLVKDGGAQLLSFDLYSKDEMDLTLELLKATGWTVDCTYRVQAWETANEVTMEVDQ